MDSVLKERLSRWSDHIEKLKKIEEVHFQLEASEKPLFYRLFSQASGRTVSERESFVYQHEDWNTFQKGLAESRAEHNAQKRRLELLIAAHTSEYLAVKHEHEFIAKKGG